MIIDVNIIKIVTRSQYVGSVITYPFLLSALETDLGAYVSSVAWSTESDAVTLGTSSISSSIAGCPITAVNAGDALIKIQIDFDNGDTLLHYFIVSVENPL